MLSKCSSETHIPTQIAVETITRETRTIPFPAVALPHRPNATSTRKTKKNDYTRATALRASIAVGWSSPRHTDLMTAALDRAAFRSLFPPNRSQVSGKGERGVRAFTYKHSSKHMSLRSWVEQGPRHERMLRSVSQKHRDDVHKHLRKVYRTCSCFQR